MRMMKPSLRSMDMRSLKPPPKLTDPHYGTAAHKRWAADVKARDGAQCQDPEHVGDRSSPDGIADHVKERRDGGADLDLANGLWRCRSCHSIKTAKAKRERAAIAANFGASHPSWMRPSKVPLLMVCGPPASGKTTVAKAFGGLLIDLDEIAQSLFGCPAYACDGDMLGQALHRRNDALGSLSHFQLRCDRAAFVVSEPSAEKRQWWVDKLRPAEVRVCETPEQVCFSRIISDPARAAYRESLSEAVVNWWSNYDPRAGEKVVRCH